MTIDCSDTFTIKGSITLYAFDVSDFNPGGTFGKIFKDDWFIALGKHTSAGANFTITATHEVEIEKEYKYLD